jgi:hypothetical protein
MSNHKREYDVFKGLLNGEQVNTLTSEQIQTVVLGKASQSAVGKRRLHILKDGCDIRKPSSSDMEHLGKVLSLSKQVINGYQSMNSIAIDADNQTLSLLYHELYSNKHPNYVSQETLHNLELASPKELSLIASGEAINTKILYQKSIKKVHQTLKSANESVILSYISDREFDDIENYEYIDALGDEFITRAKLSRVSHEVQATYTPKGKLSKRTQQVKLVDKSFANKGQYLIEKLTIKNKTYYNATALLEWEDLKLSEISGAKTYQVVRITLLKSDKKPVFEHPMLLITNRRVDSLAIAKEIYHAYLLRFKIEVVFKFLKQNIGWETFQVRDWESIKNLLALVFFMVGYFKELEEELKKHPMAKFIVDLAFSKGKITTFFLLKGIEKLVNFIQVKAMIDQNNITNEQINELFQQLGLQKEVLRSY